ncbi:peptidoglycan-binding protein [Patescibacteria group bacterium]|nr:peptidoglycan-binding protein [Patescibacteria group bacterium]
MKKNNIGIILASLALFISIPIQVFAYSFQQPINVGSSGTDVSALQQFLKEKEYYTYSAITGYYGTYTTQAVQAFQRAQGIVSSGVPAISGYGRVGPRTLAAINASGSSPLTTTQPTQQLQFTRDLQVGTIGEDVRKLQQFLNANGYTVAEAGAGSKGKETTTFGSYTKLALIRYQLANNIQATGTFDTQTRTKIGSTSTTGTTQTSPVATTVKRRGGGGGSSNTASDTTAPTVSAVSSNTPGHITATITWNTNESADSQIEYGTTTGYGSLTTLDSTLVTSHSVTLTGLTANTTYHYRVISKDASSNTTTSSDYTFTTALAPDVVAPVLSAISAGSLAQTTAVITWTTNELSDSQVEYGTTTSYGSLTTTDNTLVTSHSVSLTGLTANTTYHYRVISKDVSNNSATSTDRTFTTASAMPSGALGLWYIDEYDSTSRASIPNSVASSEPSNNLLNAPRRMFANNEWWYSDGIMNDATEIAPDGTNDASTLNGVGNWMLRSASGENLPAGTYTMAINVKSNTGSNQQFSFYTTNTLVRSDPQIATDSWQRFSYTFTINSPMSVGQIGIGSIDGSTDANLQVIDFNLYRGSSDLGPGEYDGHLYLGLDAFDTVHTYQNGELDLSTGGFGLIQFDEEKVLETMTVQALISKVDTTGYSSILSSVQSYVNFSAMSDQSSRPASYFDGGSTVGPDQDVGLWKTEGKGYHVVTLRYDGTRFDYWLDDVKILSNVTDRNPVTISDLFVNITNAQVLYGKTKYAGAIGLWDRALSDTEVRNAVAYQQERAAQSAITAENASRVLVAEGDSITGAYGFSYPYKYGPNANPSVYGINYATNGAAIATMVNRAQAVDSIIPPNTTDREFILSVFIGANGLSTTYSGPNGSGVSGWLAELAEYLDTRKAAGWKIAVCTVLPNSNASFNEARDEANAVIRTWVGTHADAICDFGADPIMGDEATTANTTYYLDGQHPAEQGHVILETIYRATINAM